MENICPVCNKITKTTFLCDQCGGLMIDKGRAQEYLDDYSADMPIEDGGTYCTHLYQCTNCNLKTYKKINHINI